MSSQDIDPRLRALSSTSQLPNLQPNTSSTSSSSQIPNSTSSASIPSLPPYPPLQNVASPQQQPYSHTAPQSAINHPEESGQDNGLVEDGPNDPKRPRACEACRGLKVKCDPDPNGGPCKRCAKANRVCEVTQPSRKRQKKTDSRVADLEKKIEILQRLTASIHPKATESALLGLEAQNQDSHASPYQHISENGQPVQRTASASNWSPYSRPPEAAAPKDIPMVVEAGRQRKRPVESPSMGNLGSLPALANRAAESRALFEQVGKAFAGNSEKNVLANIYADVIDRNVLTLIEAEQIFRCYIDKMAPHLPAVVFPPGTTMSTIRKEKPVLFLAILVVGAGPVYPEVQPGLNKELTSVLATRIMIQGEKSLELVQALQLSTLWYYPPEHFEELKFYQLVHIAAVMALDIGLGKPNKPGKAGTTAGLFRDNQWRRQPFPNSDSIESRRAWLCCYFLCCNTSMGLRRPNLIRWTHYMAECLKVLETSPEAYPSDLNFCAWVRSQHIAEEVGYQFSMDDPTAKISISDDKVNYALKKFEQDLVQWHEELPSEARSASLEMTGHIISLYMHEIAMHVDHNVDEFQPPYHESTINGLVSEMKSSQPLTTSHVEALSACLTAIDGVFEVFLRHDTETVRCLPVPNFVRVAYATVVLMKMSIAASNPESAIGKIFVASKLRTEEYVDGLIQLFNAASAEHKSRPSAKFLMVLVMLKTWFQRRNRTSTKVDAVDELRPNSSTNRGGDLEQSQTTHQNANEQQKRLSNYGPTNTPLDVLSDVATGNSRRHPSDSNQYTGQSENWHTGPQVQYPPYSANVMQQNFSGDISNDVNMNNFGGFDYSSGLGGLGDAMGMMAEFGAYVGDNNFFIGNEYDYTNF